MVFGRRYLGPTPGWPPPGRNPGYLPEEVCKTSVCWITFIIQRYVENQDKFHIFLIRSCMMSVKMLPHHCIDMSGICVVRISLPDPKPGTLVDMVRVKKIGPFILGPVLGNSPVKSIVQCLARQEKTDKFFTVKVPTF